MEREEQERQELRKMIMEGVGVDDKKGKDKKSKEEEDNMDQQAFSTAQGKCINLSPVLLAELLVLLFSIFYSFLVLKTEDLN